MATPTNPQNLYEYYTGKGQKLPSVQERSSVYEKSGLGSALSYTGTAPQNTALLGYLQKQPTPTGKFAIQPTPAATPLTSPQVNGSAAQASASFQPQTQPSPQVQPQIAPTGQIQPSEGVPQPISQPASTLISPETGLLKSKPSPFKTAAEKTIAEGTSEIPDPGTARAIISQEVPQTQGLEKSTNFLQTDPFFQNLVSTFQEYISPKNQRESLTQTYQKMVKDSGIEALDLELINTKRIIEGTTEDIRREIQSSGGYASESQILMLANSRSKSLIRNFNVLLETRNAKEKYLNTMIGLEQQDRQMADQKFEQSFNMAFQIADYGQKMRRNAIESLDRTRSAIGWVGVLQATGGDSSEIGLIERAYGLPTGGLRLAVQEEMRMKAQTEQERLLGLEEKRTGLALKKEQVETEKAQRAKIYSDIGKEGKEGIKVQQRKQNTLIQANTVISKVDEALKQVGGYNVGLVGRGLALIPGTKAYNLNKTIDTIKSNVGFQALQAMREASPTGGALGQIAVQELTMLQATIASLDIGQSKTQLTKNLNEVKQRFNNAKAIIIAGDEGKEITYDGQGNVIILEN